MLAQIRVVTLSPAQYLTNLINKKLVIKCSFAVPRNINSVQLLKFPDELILRQPVVNRNDTGTTRHKVISMRGLKIGCVILESIHL
jgi:hypothetical protein